MRIIRGKYGRRRFDVPANITARPTTDFAKENIFNVIENMIDLEGISALDLFAGTGAISFELLSRGASRVTAVEKAPVQGRFIAETARKLGDDNLKLIRMDALRFISAAPSRFDFIFADPPYDLDGFADIPGKVLASGMIAPGGLFIIEHSAKYDFSVLPHFHSHRAYGSVNFSLFLIPSADDTNE
ncbi:MAG: RsmD family RNA methyltransferase [Pseudoflavonifractor sp.]|nr:RsmD family RNA methyltransferase [Alloprevotella sp.]MCM1117133.1 RsmD family RNA methyltransferase [Pseudoflavonifractor sp.]